MIVNQQALRGLYTGFSLLFQKAFTGVTPLYTQIATVVPSENGEENYKWLGALPTMREWIGDRQIKSLTASDYTIRNKDYEVTVGVPRNDIEDDRLGLYNPAIQMLGQSAAQHPDTLVFDLLRNGFSNKCYDGLPFFSDKHKVGAKEVSNKGTMKLSADSYSAARSAMMSVTNDKGVPLTVIPDLLVVPPALEAEALKILKADVINGSTNVLKGTAQLLVAPQLAGADSAWYLLSTTRPIRPLIFQERQKPKFVGVTGDSDENVFMRKEFMYGVDARGNAGYGLWQLAYGSVGTV